MERLMLSQTEHFCVPVDAEGAYVTISRQWYEEAKDKLAAYETAEEQNRLIMLPHVKPKDTVWYPWCGKVTKDYVSCFMFTNQGDAVICFSGRDGVKFDEIGKTVFLTEAEAQQALKDRSDTA